MIDDLQLLEQWRRGDQRAGNTLFERHFDSLYRFLANKVPDDAQDLIQETFLACVSSRDRFAGRASFRTYLFTIARNKLYTHLGRLKRRREHLDFDQLSIADLGITPSQLLERDGRYRVLLQALRSLPVTQQELLELHFWEDMGYEEIAVLFGIDKQAVAARFFRARKALFKQVQRIAANDFRSRRLEDLDSWARGVRKNGPLSTG